MQIQDRGGDTCGGCMRIISACLSNQGTNIYISLNINTYIKKSVFL